MFCVEDLLIYFFVCGFYAPINVAVAIFENREPDEPDIVKDME